MSYTKLLCHIVIRTKHSIPAISNEHSESLYRYMWGYIKNKQCVLYRINGMPDHIHLLVQLHPTIAVSNFVKELKTSSHHWIKQTMLFPTFAGWGKEYAAFSCNYKDREKLIDYIRKQREHHAKINSTDELKVLLNEANVQYNEHLNTD